ncbi:hypothetical protein [Ekhidna sp.]|uniref:hypothetical protein n=1 Tax=Ekhidna sp. TaxID=2608089 RepID=UPI0032987677
MSNTYNKELSSSMKNSGKEFIKEQYKLDHKKEAAKVALYYAHGQTEKNENAFETTKEDSKAAESLNKKAVKSSNLTENVVTAAKQSLLDSSSATSNVSTAAANMQTAANAITKLAGDVAALLSVASNTANESKIQEHTESANKLIQDASRRAEEVSLVSMQATIEAAQASASSVVTDSEASLAAVKELHGSTSSNYNNLQNEAIADNENLTEARKNEKLASAVHDISVKKDKAITNTRKQINLISNYELLMFDPQIELEKAERRDKGKKKKDDELKELSILPITQIPQGDSYAINFEAFDDEENIQYYRLIVAKYDDAEAFDINIAKDLKPGTYYQFEPITKRIEDGKEADISGRKIYSNVFHLLGVKEKAESVQEGNEITLGPNTWNIIPIDNNQQLFFSNVDSHLALDYKGKPIDRGEPYVTFVYAVYNPDYQHTINSTVGLLSQPSKRLTLQWKLYSPRVVNLHQSFYNSKNMAASFQLPIKYYDPNSLEYRVMLLESENVQAEAINKKIEKAISELEKAEYSYNAKNELLQEFTTRLDELNLQYESLDNQIKIAKHEGDTKEVKRLEGIQVDVVKERGQIEDRIKGPNGQEELTRAAKIRYQNAQTHEAKVTGKKKSDFIFDEDLMLQVTAANYYVAVPNKWTFKSAFVKFLESFIDYEVAKYDLRELIINAEPDLVKELRDKYNTQLTQIQLITANVDSLEKELKELKKRLDKLDKDDPERTELKKVIALIQFEYDKEKNNLKNANNELHNIEREIEVAMELGDEVSPAKLESYINTMVEAGYNVKKYEELLGLILWTYFDEFIIDIIEFEKELKKLIQVLWDFFGYVAEEIIELILEGKIPTFEIPEDEFVFSEEVPSIVLMYTEVGEDATDNYGEPLFQNQSNYIKDAIVRFESIVSKNKTKDARKAKFDTEIKWYSPEEIMDSQKKKAKKGYQSIVFSTLSATNVQEVPEYENNHSHYSNEIYLYKTQ